MTQIAQIYTDFFNEKSVRIRIIRVIRVLKEKRMNQLGELFDTSIPNISMHISNILKEKALDESSVIKDYLTTAKDFSVVRQEATCKDFLHVQMRAESPIGNSVGQSPTSTAQKMFKPCKGVGERITPLQGLQWWWARNVGLHPTLLTTPFQG